jgi:hypothetical protein
MSSPCPFSVLGLASNNAPAYKEVKRKFVELALQHHPDRSGGSADSFLKVRQAFEAIRELPDGTCTLSDQLDGLKSAGNSWSDDRISDWFFRETGQSISFRIDYATRKQIAIAATLAPGGLDRGGMWEMARMIAQEERCNPSSEEPKQVQGGENNPRRRKRT